MGLERAPRTARENFPGENSSGRAGSRPGPNLPCCSPTNQQGIWIQDRRDDFELGGIPWIQRPDFEYSSLIICHLLAVAIVCCYGKGSGW